MGNVFINADLPQVEINATEIVVNQSQSVVVVCNGSGTPQPTVKWDISDWTTHSISIQVNQLYRY